MNRTSPATLADRQTSWPAARAGHVPTQASAGLQTLDRPRPASAVGVSLRDLGVDTAQLFPAPVLPAAAPTAAASRFAERPRPAEPQHVLRAGRSQCLAVAHLLSQPSVVLGQVAQVIDTDPVLTLRVLHLANTHTVRGAEVDTVAQAVVLLGARELSALVGSLLLEARAGAMDHLWLVLARALTCESLAGDAAAYTVGLLSGLADELGVPADVVLVTAGVSATVADAVRYGEGPLGRVLAAVTSHEADDRVGIVRTGLAPVDVYDAYLRAFTDAMATEKAVNPA